ncbi:hypothetical protein LEMLEM_LOCUS9167, partial [Lemmus lemmus]
MSCSVSERSTLTSPYCCLEAPHTKPARAHHPSGLKQTPRFLQGAIPAPSPVTMTFQYFQRGQALLCSSAKAHTLSC